MGCDLLIYITLVRISSLLTIFIILHWGLCNERFRSDPECGAKFCIVWGVIKIMIGLALWLVLDLAKCDDGKYHKEYIYCIFVGLGCIMIGWVYSLQAPHVRTPLLSDDGAQLVLNDAQ